MTYYMDDMWISEKDYRVLVVLRDLNEIIIRGDADEEVRKAYRKTEKELSHRVRGYLHRSERFPWLHQR